MSSPVWVFLSPVLDEDEVTDVGDASLKFREEGRLCYVFLYYLHKIQK